MAAVQSEWGREMLGECESCGARGSAVARPRRVRVQRRGAYRSASLKPLARLRRPGGERSEDELGVASGGPVGKRLCQSDGGRGDGCARRKRCRGTAKGMSQARAGVNCA